MSSDQTARVVSAIGNAFIGSLPGGDRTRKLQRVSMKAAPQAELRLAIILVKAGLMLISRKDLGKGLLILGAAVFVRSLLAPDGDGGWGGNRGWWFGASGPRRPTPGEVLHRLAEVVSPN